jgi:hypothetical protein
MEITKVWGREIAIRSVVRGISALGMYFGRGKDGRSYFLVHERFEGTDNIRQADRLLLSVLGDRDLASPLYLLFRPR